MSAVSYELDGRVGILTLNRPDSLNAVNPDMVAGLLAASARVADDPAARAVVVRGASSPAGLAVGASAAGASVSGAWTGAGAASGAFAFSSRASARTAAF